VSRLWIFPGIYLLALGWLALIGLGVPAALVERRGYADALRRGIQLARADYVHALGSLATLAITIFLTGLVIFFALREGSGQALRIAAVVALVVLAPVFVLGAAVLYVDQKARVESGPRPRRKRDADLHSALELDGTGRSDAEGKP
jgi:multisubunit Na+/H+ antiporter MnhG subunit